MVGKGGHSGREQSPKELWLTRHYLENWEQVGVVGVSSDFGWNSLTSSVSHRAWQGCRQAAVGVGK